MSKLSITSFSILSMFFLSTSVFSSMAVNINSNIRYNDELQKDKKKEISNFSDLLNILKLQQPEKSEFDAKLKQLNGNNLSNFPLSEEMYKWIEQKVGFQNQKPFVFKTGPQIIFEDEIDLKR